jgi:hypothetical protein
MNRKARRAGAITLLALPPIGIVLIVAGVCSMGPYWFKEFPGTTDPALLNGYPAGHYLVNSGFAVLAGTIVLFLTMVAIGGGRAKAVQTARVPTPAPERAAAPVSAMLGASRKAPPSRIRATDQDRDAVVAELVRAHGSGALDPVEFDDRMSRALQAKTRGDLSALLADLP